MKSLAARAAGAFFITALVAFCAIESFGGETTLRGRAQVVDGDDVVVDGRKIRLSGIDAFEWDQICEDAGGRHWPCGAEAKALLQSLVQGREIACALRSWSKKYRRWNAICRLEGRDIAEELVRAGLAFDVPKFSGGRYKKLEQNAEAIGAGAWEGTFTYPWQYRALKAAAEEKGT